VKEPLGGWHWLDSKDDRPGILAAIDLAAATRPGGPRGLAVLIREAEKPEPHFEAGIYERADIERMLEAETTTRTEPSRAPQSMLASEEIRRMRLRPPAFVGVWVMSPRWREDIQVPGGTT